MACGVKSRQVSLLKKTCDPHAALLGQCDEDSRVACTLLGSHTGLGSYCVGDIALVNYGPQLYPLGVCSQFGLHKTVNWAKGEKPDVFVEANDIF